MPTAIDLFCGAGGLTASLEAVGYKTVAMVDNAQDAIQTLRSTQSARLPISSRGGEVYLSGAKILHADIREISAADLRPEGSQSDWAPDLLSGGAPCQPFSSAGKGLALNDPRGQLFREFVRLADELKPRTLLFENVAGLITAKDEAGEPGGVLRQVQRSFEDIGYVCRVGLLNSADFGSAQRRVRLYLIASRFGRPPEFPRVTNSRSPDAEAVLPWVNLGDFLAQQPSPDEADIVRPSGKRAHELNALLPGTGLKSGGIVEANRPSGHWGYRQDSFLADLSLPSRTIRAASTPDWVKTEEGLRRLTWRECAALQGFPEGWCFVGSTASRFRQIGNAVQGDVGRAIAKKLVDQTEFEPASESIAWPDTFKRRMRYTKMEEAVNGQHRLDARKARDAIKALNGRAA